MADGGSSGGGWSALEIIIVLILVLALLGKLFGTGSGIKPITVPDVATYKGDKNALAPSFNNCGKLLMTAPKPLEKVKITSTGVAVAGTITTCNTIFVAPDTFTVTIVDAQGLPLSPAAVVPVSATRDTWAFNAFIQFNVPPRPGNGYVLVTRTRNTGAQVPNGGARLPIRFVNQ
ncbi:MAG TPA: hypothetical protein VGE18_01770 [Candidatus Paceibacterota bacterium]